MLKMPLVDENQQLTASLRDEIVRRILSVGSPLKILLFGSLAKGCAKPTSDLDLLIIEESLEDPWESIRMYSNALRHVSERDENIEVVSIKEILEWQSVPNSFLSTVVAEGTVLYQVGSAQQAAAEELVVNEGYTPKTNADLARGYFELAEKHLATVHLVMTGPGPFNDVCFLLHQVIEKYLKGFIGFHGKSVPHVHDLVELYAACKSIDPLQELASFDLKDISTFYIEARYHRYFNGNRARAERALAAAEAARQAILARLPPEAHP